MEESYAQAMTLKLGIVYSTCNAYAVALVTVAMNAHSYFDGDALTEKAILNKELLTACLVGTTQPRCLPKSLSMKDSDQFDYYTKNVRITYPRSGSSTTTIIPGVVMHCDMFDQFGKTGVYVGIPQSFVEILRTKLESVKTRPVFDDPIVASDEKYWWTRCGFNPAEENKEYIFVVDEDADGLLENPYTSFQDLFSDVGSSVVVNLTCSIKMTTKIECTRKGAFEPTDEWKMGISASRVNVLRAIDIEKPRASAVQKTIVGSADKADSGLLKRIKERQQNRIK